MITPFFGFETVPQMVEEGDFPIKDSNKAILGSIVSCGLVYALFFFGLGGMPVQSLVEEGGAAVNGFLAITMMEQLGGGWSIFAVIFLSLIHIWFKRCVYQLCTGRFLNHRYYAEGPA